MHSRLNSLRYTHTNTYTHNTHTYTNTYTHNTHTYKHTHTYHRTHTFSMIFYIFSVRLLMIEVAFSFMEMATTGTCMCTSEVRYIKIYSSRLFFVFLLLLACS